MEKTYKAKVNNQFDFEIDKTSITNLDSLSTSSSEFHILHDNQSYKAQITEAIFNEKKYKVKVNNNTYNILINNELDFLIKEMGFEIGAVKKVNNVKAPMPGLILDINVSVGQEVKENEMLLILEAMKMENVLNAPRDCVIKTISINKGDAVDKNQLLIEFE